MADGEIDNLNALKHLLADLIEVEEVFGQKRIRAESKYSSFVTERISSLEELLFYQEELELKEAKMTRPSLIRQWIDTRLKDKDGVTNMERMLKGNPPVTSSRGQSSLELHHIRQDYDGPFAELTPTQHRRPGKGINLHPKTKWKKESWRHILSLNDLFNRERGDYWVMRGDMLSGQGNYESISRPRKVRRVR